MMMWHCDYCGHQQDADARKCADCGGPRGDFYASPEVHPDSWLGLYQQHLTDERIKAQKALTDDLSEAFENIGWAFLPVMEIL